MFLYESLQRKEKALEGKKKKKKDSFAKDIVWGKN